MMIWRAATFTTTQLIFSSNLVIHAMKKSSLHLMHLFSLSRLAATVISNDIKVYCGHRDRMSGARAAVNPTCLRIQVGGLQREAAPCRIVLGPVRESCRND